MRVFTALAPFAAMISPRGDAGSAVTGHNVTPVEQIEIAVRIAAERDFSAMSEASQRVAVTPGFSPRKLRDRRGVRVARREQSIDLPQMLDRNRHCQSPPPLRRRASTVMGSVVHDHFGSCNTQPLAKVTDPPQRSGFSCATIGSSRSFLGT